MTSTKSKVIGFGCISLGCQDNITKTFTVGKLTEHQDAKLVIAGKLLDIFVAAIFTCEIAEVVTKSLVVKHLSTSIVGRNFQIVASRRLGLRFYPIKRAYKRKMPF